MGFFRKIILLQLVGLVLTYNFTNCNYTKIGENYENIIFHALTEYMNETKSNKFEQIYFCYNQSDCLTKIERHTFNPAGGCRSLPKEHFALETSSTFVVCCPGYSRIQINNTQEMKQRKFKRSCQNQASQILGLWRGFIRPP